MSFLLQKNLSAHLHLHLMALSPLDSSPEAALQKLNLLARTRRFDLIAECAKSLSMPFPSLGAKLQAAQKQSEEQKEKLFASKVFERLVELDEMSKAEDPDFEAIDQAHFKIFELAKILFEEGSYADSLKVLVQLEKQELKQQLWLKSTWARLYCEILLNRDDAFRTLEALKRKIQEVEGEELSLLGKQKKENGEAMKRFYAQREEFLLLALFVAFRKGGDDQLEKWVDLCTADKAFFSILQLTCPELLRYLTAALIINKTLQNNKDNRTFDFFKLVEVINRKIIRHTDAFTDFLSLLEIDFDFESAIAKISSCRALIQSDPFLRPFEHKLIEGLNFLYFKQACKVYETLPLSEIASFTGLGAEEGELWLLGYIRSGDIDAKIDSIAELVVNNKGRQSSSEKYVDVIPGLGAFVAGLSRSVASH